nr:MAG TPA: hypothetical protein [Caudoviricetes sp.]
MSPVVRPRGECGSKMLRFVSSQSVAPGYASFRSG